LCSKKFLKKFIFLRKYLQFLLVKSTLQSLGPFQHFFDKFLEWSFFVVTGSTTNLCPANNIFLVCASRLLLITGHVVVSYTTDDEISWNGSRIPTHFHPLPSAHREKVINGQNDLSFLNSPASCGHSTSNLRNI